MPQFLEPRLDLDLTDEIDAAHNPNKFNLAAGNSYNAGPLAVGGQTP